LFYNVTRLTLATKTNYEFCDFKDEIIFLVNHKVPRQNYL